MKKLNLALAALGVLATAAFAADKPIKSGLQQGEMLNPFQVVDTCGPDKGSQLCLV